MALALQPGIPDRQIMALGRWRSSAFLSYIRPQVLEWAGNTATTMTETTRFHDDSRQPIHTSRTGGSLPNHQTKTPTQSGKMAKVWKEGKAAHRSGS